MAKQLTFEMQVSPLTPPAPAPAPETPAAVYHTAAGIRERLERYGVQSLIEAELVSALTGTLNASVFHPREIFRFAIEHSANSIVLVHNHPSGNPQPSAEDIRATKQLVEAGENIGIKVLDHIIIGDGIFRSLKEEGQM